MVQAQVRAKLNYKPKSSVEVFYSGGAVAVSRNQQLACACQDDIKVCVSAKSVASACRCVVYGTVDRTEVVSWYSCWIQNPEQ